MTPERTHLRDLLPDDRFRLTGWTHWARVTVATTESVHATSPNAGDFTLDLADVGGVEADVERADHTGTLRISILRWHRAAACWVHHQTCFIPQDWTRCDLHLAGTPLAFVNEVEELLALPGAARMRLRHHILVKEA